MKATAMSSSVLILNGPNLNMLGSRDVAIYGTETLASIETRLKERARNHGFDIDFRQSNSEGELVGWVQEARGKACGVIINAAAYTHSSIALLDALALLDCPVIEVHLSNIYRRESFRKTSYVAQAAKGVIAGFGGDGYLLALEALSNLLGKR